MEELFLETKNGNIAIDPQVVKKFNLEKGTLSPFTRNRIVGKHGEYPSETSAEKDPKNNVKTQKPEDEPDGEQNGGVVLTTSEIIDFAQGTDSSTVR
jgi:hypothetical protein